MFSFVVLVWDSLYLSTERPAGFATVLLFVFVFLIPHGTRASDGGFGGALAAATARFGIASFFELLFNRFVSCLPKIFFLPGSGEYHGIFGNWCLLGLPNVTLYPGTESA